MNRSRWRILRILAAHPRLFTSSAFGTAVAGVASLGWADGTITPLLIGWNAGAFLYIVSALKLIQSCEQASIRQRARVKSEGEWAVFTFSILSGLAGLCSTVAGLSMVREIHGVSRAVHIGLTALTIATAWFFTHLMFAQEYAHRYYRGLENGGGGGLLFPGEEMPDYHDFLYLSIVIGTSAQTADVCFSSRSMRRLATVHCLLAFLFNTTVLALTVNMASGLF
jgi:uncharacterized membrane protein